VARKVQVPDDLGTQERDDVGADGELKAGEDLLGDRGASDDVAPFEDQDLLAGAREIRRVDEPVVPASDDDDVVLHAHAWVAKGSIVTAGFVGGLAASARAYL